MWFIFLIDNMPVFECFNCDSKNYGQWATVEYLKHFNKWKNAFSFLFSLLYQKHTKPWPQNRRTHWKIVVFWRIVCENTTILYYIITELYFSSEVSCGCKIYQRTRWKAGLMGRVLLFYEKDLKCSQHATMEREKGRWLGEYKVYSP